MSHLLGLNSISNTPRDSLPPPAAFYHTLGMECFKHGFVLVPCRDVRGSLSRLILMMIFFFLVLRTGKSHLFVDRCNPSPQIQTKSKHPPPLSWHWYKNGPSHKVTSQAQKFILNFDVTRGMYQPSHWRSQSKASHCASHDFNRIMNQLIWAPKCNIF